MSDTFLNIGDYAHEDEDEIQDRDTEFGNLIYEMPSFREWDKGIVGNTWANLLMKDTRPQSTRDMIILPSLTACSVSSVQINCPLGKVICFWQGAAVPVFSFDLCQLPLEHWIKLYKQNTCQVLARFLPLHLRCGAFWNVIKPGLCVSHGGITAK